VHEARTIALLLQLVRLPDVDFLFSEAEQVCFHAPHVPIVAHETGDGCAHILAPPRALKSLPDAARWLSRASGVGIYAWEKRRQQAFFRGRQSGGALFDSNGEPSSIRAKVVDFGAKHPQLLDARFAGRGGSLRGAKAETAKRRNWSLDDAFLTWEEGLEYRATVVVDGNTVADRLAYLMASMTAIIKQESDRREALSSCMVPYVHYVPLKPDVSDLEEQITWALANETRLRQIAEAGAELVISHFSRRAQLCYWATLIRRISAHVSHPIAVHPEATVAAPRHRSFFTWHEPLVQQPNPLRPQLSHDPPRMSDLLVLARLHVTPCTELTSTHLCVDL